MKVFGKMKTKFIREFRGQSLRTQLMLTVGSLVASMSLFSLIFFPSRMSSALTQALTNQARDTVTMLAGGAATLSSAAIAFNDTSTLDPILNALMQQSSIAYISIRRDDGSFLAALPNKTAIPPLVEMPNDTSLGGKAILVSQRMEQGILRADSRIVARTARNTMLTVTIGFNTEELASERTRQTLTIALVSFLVFLVGIASAFAIGTFLLNPIHELIRITRLVAHTGDLNHKIESTAPNDEIGMLGDSFQKMMEKLQIVPMAIHEIGAAVSDLTTVTQDHAVSTQQQAGELAQTTATVQEIVQISSTAAAKAETVIGIAFQADQISKSGQAAVDNSLLCLHEIQTQIDEIIARITDLAEQTHKMGDIINMVKELADQSQLLAINASLEAARAGEFGKCFAIIAQEIRTLADQSIQATIDTRKVLSSIEQAICATIVMTAQGQANMERSISQIRASGNSIVSMSGFIVESSQAAREIADLANQQNSGIAQICTGIEQLNSAMANTTEGMHRAEQAAANLSDLSKRLSQILPNSTN